MRKSILLVMALVLASYAADAAAWHFFDRKPAEVAIESRDALNALVEMKIDIDSVGPDRARAFRLPPR